MPDKIDINIWEVLGQWIAESRPAIESFVVGLILAALTAAIDYIQSGQAFDWKALAVAVLGAIANYVTSKSRHEAAKKAGK